MDGSWRCSQDEFAHGMIGLRMAEVPKEMLLTLKFNRVHSAAAIAPPSGAGIVNAASDASSSGSHRLACGFAERRAGDTFPVILVLISPACFAMGWLARPRSAMTSSSASLLA